MPKMEAVEVYVSDGKVCIKQDCYPGEAQVILLEPGQVELVIDWLMNAVGEADGSIGEEAAGIIHARMEADRLQHGAKENETTEGN